MADDLFTDFDMLVAISQGEINTQLSRTYGIPTTMFLGQTTDTSGSYAYTTYPSASEVPKDAPFIAATFTPQVRIAATGSVINFALAFTSGSAGFVEAPGPLGLKTYDVSGWVYEVAINLDLTAVAALGNVPENVQAQLSAFTPTMFEIQSLFMDFDSANLVSFTPVSTAPGGPSDGLTQLGQFMQFYLRDQVKDHNPFILGYTATAKSAQQANPDVPALLQPTGTTFTLYQDPNNADRSTLNFALVTAGGHVSIPGSPPNLTQNPLPEGRDIAAIYSHNVLAEPMLVHPIFDQLYSGVYAQIQGKIDAPPGNGYDSAKTPLAAGGWNFAISNQGGDDTYNNNFTATIGPDDQITFAGSINVYKENDTNMGFCTAKAWAWSNLSWNVSVTLGFDELGLTVSSQVSLPPADAGTDTNGCADTFSWLGSIVGGMFDALTGLLDDGFFSNLFSGGISVPNIGDIRVALQNVGSTQQTGIVLPTGQVYTPQQPAFDPDGNVVVPMIPVP